MQHEIPELDAKGLRDFALKMAAVIAPLFGAVLPWLFDFAYPLWPWVFGGVLALWGLLAPTTLNRVYRGWMHVGMAVGTFNSKVILSLMFFVVILPAGAILRLLGKDPMLRKLRTPATSYRVPSKVSASDHVEKPY